MSQPVYIEQEIAKALKQSGKVKAICRGRIYSVKIPQGVKFPVVAYQRIYTRPDMTLRGYSSETVVIQVNSFALDYDEAKQLAMAVREVLAKAPLHGEFETEHDTYNDDSGVYCVTAEYAFQQSGGFCYE